MAGGGSESALSDLVCLAALLGGSGPVSHDAMVKAVALLERHRGRVPVGERMPPPLAVSEFISKSQEEQDRSLHRLAEPVLMKVLLPQGCRHILDGAGQGGSMAVAPLECAGAVRVLLAWLFRGRQQSVAAGALIRGTGDALVGGVRELTKQVSEHLASSDLPDPLAISFDVLKLDATRWLLEELGDQKGLEEISWQARRLARVTLTRATKVIERFLSSRDVRNLLDHVAVLSQVDGLVVIAAKVLEGRDDPADRPTPFVVPADTAALEGFLAALDRLVALLANLAARSLGRPTINRDLFQGLIDQFRFVDRWCGCLEGATPPPKLIELRQTVHKEVLGLIERIGQGIVDAARAGGSDYSALATALDQGCQLLEVLGPELMAGGGGGGGAGGGGATAAAAPSSGPDGEPAAETPETPHQT